jgi:GTP-binding protein Era
MKSGFVSILGRPNAGKSTLLNALLGQKLAIVTAKPQTTRTSIQGVVTTEDYQIVFVDTPGIHRSNTLLNKRMMDVVRTSASADVVLFLIDVLEPFRDEDAEAVDLVKKIQAPAIAVLNKVDKLQDKAKLLALIEHLRSLHEFAEFIPISAAKGTGIDTLLKEIVKRLPEGDVLYPEDHLTDQPSRFLAAEILREKILHHTQQEVPHAVAVMIDSWEETPKVLKIAATIYVEKPGQKAILIGAGGAGLKKIGTLARFEMEKAFERKIFLQTFVKVKPNWRQDPEFLAAIDWRSMLGQ